MICEDVVVLIRDVENYDLKAGDVGAVVHCYDAGNVYEVEFVTPQGKTVALLTLNQRDIRLMGDSEILHVRDMATS